MKLQKTFHINVVDRWRGTTNLEHFMKTNEFPKGSMKIWKEMNQLSEKKQKKIIYKIGDAQCSVNSLIKLKDKSFDQNIMEYLVTVMKSAYERCHHAYIFGPGMEWTNMADRMRSNFFSDKFYQGKGIFYYRFIVFIQDEDLFEENWSLFIYNTSSKEMMYLFGEENDQSLIKLKHVEKTCLSIEWERLRIQAVSNSKDGKLLKTDYFNKKTLPLKRIKMSKVVKSELIDNCEKENFGLLCIWCAIVCLSVDDGRNKSIALLTKDKVAQLRMMTLCMMIGNDMDYFPFV